MDLVWREGWAPSSEVVSNTIVDSSSGKMDLYQQSRTTLRRSHLLSDRHEPSQDGHPSEMPDWGALQSGVVDVSSTRELVWYCDYNYVTSIPNK